MVLEAHTDLGQLRGEALTLTVDGRRGEHGQESVARRDGEAFVVEPPAGPVVHGTDPGDEDLPPETGDVDIATEHSDLLRASERGHLQARRVGHVPSRVAPDRTAGGDDAAVGHRVFGERGDRVIDDEVGDGDRILVSRRGGRDALDEPFDDSVDDRPEQLISGSDEVVDGGGRDARPVGDPVGGEVVEGGLVEQFDRSVEDRFGAHRLVSLAQAGHRASLAGSRFLDNSLILESTTTMRHDEQIRLVKELLARLDSGTNVDAGGLRKNPVEVYTDPELAKREWDEFFRSRPQLIGLSGDLPEAGSFLTTEDFGVPVIATRDADGTFHAFINACRHRGAVLIEEPRGTARRLTCPFHAWTYDPEGTLVGLPKQDHFGDVDTECLSLVELPSLEWNGLLYVHPDPDGVIDPDEMFPADLAAELAEWNYGELTYLDADSYDVECNWKLAMDTFGETYHFASLHKDTLFPVFHGNVQCYDTFGINHRMILTKRAIDEMRLLPESEWDITVAGLPVYWLFPNTQLMPFERGAYLVRAFPHPTDPGRHVSRITFYLRPDVSVEEYFDEVEESRRHLIDDGEEVALQRMIAQGFANIIRDEDYWMSASQQRTAESGRVSHSLFGRNEPALHHYHSTYRSLLDLEPLPLLSEAEV